MSVYGNDIIIESTSPERKDILTKTNKCVRNFVKSNGIKLSSSTGFFRNKDFKKEKTNNAYFGFANVGGDLAFSALIGTFSPIVPVNYVTNAEMPKLKSLLKDKKKTAELEKELNDSFEDWSFRVVGWSSGHDALRIVIKEKK